MPHRVFCRGTFIELLIRICKHLYCDYIDKKDIDELTEEKKDAMTVSLPKAF